MDEHNIPDSSHDTGSDAAPGVISRESLYELVWAVPMLKVAARFGVSSSYMARVCTVLNVPRPARGYWAKLAVGKASPKPTLPDARPGDELVWARGDAQWETKLPLPKPPSDKPNRRASPVKRATTEHALITGAKTVFEEGRVAYGVGYLKPRKRLLVDIVATKTGLDKALSFANELFLALEEDGYRVVIAPHGEHLSRSDFDEREVPRKDKSYRDRWSPGRCTVVYVGTVAIGLTIFEMSEEVEVRYVNGEYVRLSEYVPPKRGRYASDHGWTSKQDLPASRLCLQAYSPYWRAEWSRQWREKPGRDITALIPVIVKELRQSAPEVARLAAEGERQAELEHQRWEAQREQWRREEEEKRAASALQDSKDELLQIINGWAESRRLAEFFLDAEQRLRDLSEGEQNEMHERLRRARELIGSVDALERFRSWRAPDER
ncbi:hypothetical protein [Cupriavidus oxalaticus]|uniref:Uncharacterized protein n=1 Tax=Cupriavidus oxalaticus TaxID=96344 RepID=A0A5P3VD09_9BURK|nr:hypothetical protein [Cupriavidus oxalaticus]QEZ44130.1 hypothetical protein D2917_07715 [Cupriavidus oxalaticus]